MRQSCAVPVARKGALMPDAHVGYGLPIGGVLACENAVIPYAVGVDIACRMKLSVLDVPPAALSSQFHNFRIAFEKGTRFGVGSVHEKPQVPNFVENEAQSPKLRAGMTLAIEPMVNAGMPQVLVLNDGWTVVTKDGSLSAHFEHTVLITEGEPEILTWPSRTPSKLKAG